MAADGPVSGARVGNFLSFRKLDPTLKMSVVLDLEFQGLICDIIVGFAFDKVSSGVWFCGCFFLSRCLYFHPGAGFFG